MAEGARQANAAPDLARSGEAAPAGEGSPSLRCRAIEADDLDAVVGLLRRGFPERSEAYWHRGFARHLARGIPAGAPRYGYVLDHGGALVGVVLTLYSGIVEGADEHLRCNLSSWYVEPRFRMFASLLDGHAMRDRAVTYLNVSPAPHTWALHEARGFRRYCRGQVIAVPALGRRGRGQSVEAFSERSAALLSPPDRTLARDHASYGCLVLVCREGGEARPVVLQRRRLKFVAGQTRGPMLPCLQLVHGPAGADLARWLGTIGRHLLRRHAMPFVVFDAEAPVAGVVGRYFEGRAPKYVKGPHPAPLGDLAYTEMVLFGP